MPADDWLKPNENHFKWGVVERIEALGYVPEIFLTLLGEILWLATKPGRQMQPKKNAS